MNERQRRADQATANAVARGMNILSVRGAGPARHYMEYKRVPGTVIARTLADPGLRRHPSAEQAVSEAITPSDAGAMPSSSEQDDI
jgi:hypothetical protein